MTLLETLVVVAIVCVLLAITVPASRVPPAPDNSAAFAACRTALDTHVVSEYNRTLRWPAGSWFFLAHTSGTVQYWHTRPDLIGMWNPGGGSWRSIILASCEYDTATRSVVRVGIPL